MKLLSCVSVLAAFAFVACGNEDLPVPDDANDAGASTSSGQPGASSSSSGGSSGASSSSSSSSSGSSGSADAGGDAAVVTCDAEAAAAAEALLVTAREHAADLAAGEICESEYYPLDIANEVQAAIDACVDVRSAYANDDVNAGLRGVLEGTLTSGLLAGLPFEEALIGSTLYGVSQGIYGPAFTLTFGEDLKVVSHECTVEEEGPVCEDRAGTYVLGVDAEGQHTISLDFENAPLTPGALTAVPDADIAAPAFVFEAEDEGMNAYTFEDICSA